MTFEAGSRRTALPADELVRWGKCRDARRGPLVLLTDGGLLAVDQVEFGERELVAASALWGEAAIPWAACRGIVLQLPRASGERDAIVQRLASSPANIDWLLLENGDVVRGELVGVAHGADAQESRQDSIAIKTAGEVVRAPRDKIAALALGAANQTPQPPAALRAWLGFADGSRLLATSIATVDGRIAITLSCGAQLQTVRPAFFADLALVQPLSPRVDYLSDLPAFGYKHIPFLDWPWPYHADRSTQGALLRHGGAIHLKGIGMHSASRLAYELGGEYRRFETELAIDEAAGDRGSVMFRVYLSGASGELQEAYVSEVIRGGAAPTPVSVDVTGAERLVLVVEYSDRGDQLDYANWLEARLIR